MSDCIIVGGGIIGLLTARELSRRDLDVLVVERGRLGGESSWAGGGIVSPLYPWQYHDSVNRLAQMSKTIYPELVADLRDETGLDSELLHSGLLVVGQEITDDVMRWAKQWEVDLSHVESGEMQQIEPTISKEMRDGLWMPEIMQVRNPKFVQALKSSCEVNGITYREEMVIDEILVENNRAIGVRSGDESLLSNNIVIASGAWSASLVQQTLDIEPVKGQMIMFRGETDQLKRMVLFKGHYVIPRSDGRILAGSTIEKVGFDKSVSDQAMEELKRTASEIIPALGEMHIERQWAGLRPGTRYGIPYICRHEAIDNVFINAGHYRNGIVLGPASAVVMADILLGEQDRFDYSPYRFDALH